MLSTGAADEELGYEFEASARAASVRWGADSEYGELTDVMLCAPLHLAAVPCCSVTEASLRQGFEPSPPCAVAQHHELARALELYGVRCHVVPAAPGLPDLAFARDASLMTPWGLLGLRLAAVHRIAETNHVMSIARSWGVPVLGRIEDGLVEGGDICLVRPGVVVIGCSGVRTDDHGAAALARFFEHHGWHARICRFDPHFLHLDTQFAMLDEQRALAAVDVLDDDFIAWVQALGIELVPVTYKEVQRLGANVLSLGKGRILVADGNGRVNSELARLGYDVVAVELDQFTRCGGGAHCLTMPLARVSA